MVIRIGSVPQLFLDDAVIERLDRCRRRVHRPVRSPRNPVVAPEKPWEAGPGHNGAYLFGGTVLFDERERRYRMWYRTSEMGRTAPTAARGGEDVDTIGGAIAEGGYRCCYAESDDGLDWRKPDLGLVGYEDESATNILPPGAGGSRFIRRPNLLVDYDDPDERRRYKMAYADEVDGTWLLRRADSPDGIRWQMPLGGAQLGPQPPYYPLGILMGWDSRHERFVHFHRKVAPGRRVDVDGRKVRSEAAIAMSASEDFERWELQADVDLRGEAVDPPAWDIGHAGMLTAFPYTDDLYVGFLDTATTWAAEDIPPDAWPAMQLDHEEHRPELVVSRDGERWTRVAPHWPFVTRGLPGTWDSQFVVLSRPIIRDDDILIYYTGRNLTCGVQHAGHPQVDLLGRVVAGNSMGYAIGLATLRRDGFASIDGDEPAGTLTTVPFRFTGDRLVINARAPERAFGEPQDRATPFGALTAAILDATGSPVSGLGHGDCDSFTGDAIRHVVTWTGDPDLGRLEGEEIRLQFTLRNAALYSFRFQGRVPPRARVNLLAPGARGHA
jgi:hypothetical protein